jgi:outer membrane immunogenic protein
MQSPDDYLPSRAAQKQTAFGCITFDSNRRQVARAGLRRKAEATRLILVLYPGRSMRVLTAAATTSFAILALSGAAVAQSVGAPIFDWSGFYVGGSIGAFSGSIDPADLAFDGNVFPLDPPLLLDLNAPAIGIAAGANMQLGHFVLGVEGDASWLNTKVVDDRSDQSLGAFIVAANLSNIATLRARVGVAVDRALFYATAGVASAQTSGQVSDIYDRGTYVYDDAQTFLGWVAGAGVEIAVSEQVSWKGEAVYHDFGSRTYTFNGDPSVGYDQITADGVLKGWTARAGLNFYF